MKIIAAPIKYQTSYNEWYDNNKVNLARLYTEYLDEETCRYRCSLDEEALKNIVTFYIYTRNMYDCDKIDLSLGINPLLIDV